MTVSNGDILRVLQFATLTTGQGVSSKFYFQVAADQPLGEDETLDAIAAWLEAAYLELQWVVPITCHLNHAQVDVIDWYLWSWRTTHNLGPCFPADVFTPAAEQCPDAVSMLLTFSTGNPRVRRTFYQWGPKQSGVDGNHLNTTNFARLVLFGVELFSPVYVSPNGSLVPVLVHALTGGSEMLTGFVATDLVSVMHRRRPRT